MTRQYNHIRGGAGEGRMGGSSPVASSPLSSCASRKSILKRDNETFGREVKGDRARKDTEIRLFWCSG